MRWSEPTDAERFVTGLRFVARADLDEAREVIEIELSDGTTYLLDMRSLTVAAGRLVRLADEDRARHDAARRELDRIGGVVLPAGFHYELEAATVSEDKLVIRLLEEHGAPLLPSAAFDNGPEAASARSVLRDYNLLPGSPCYHVWRRQYGDLREPSGIRFRCCFCPAVAIKRRATLADELFYRAERGADAPLVDPATAPAPRSTPPAAP